MSKEECVYHEVAKRSFSAEPQHERDGHRQESHSRRREKVQSPVARIIPWVVVMESLP